MNMTSSLSGDTLIACHFPLVQLPPWQLPVQSLCSSAKRPGRLCSVGLTRAASLPEQDTLHREAAFHSSLRHISSSYWSLKEDRGEEEGEGEGGSDSSGRCDSTSSPEEVPQLTNAQRKTEEKDKKERLSTGGTLRSHNSFLPTAEVDEDEEDEDSEGDNLHRYHEDSSFVLHGNSNWDFSNAARRASHPALLHGTLGRAGGDEVGTLGQEEDRDWLSNQPNQLDLLGLKCQHLHDNRADAVSMDCGEKEGGVEDNEVRCGGDACCFSYGQPKCFPESFSNGHLENVSDSSCNSSDGVLVNFCAIYNRSNNAVPASAHDLSGPAMQSSQPAGGPVFLDLQPFTKQGPQGGSSQEEDRMGSSPQGVVPSAPCWSPQALDSNCNVYPLEYQSQGLSSLEVSDLTACLQSQARLPTGPTQKYYKLVTCDLSSQSSPSPAWSSVTSCSDGQSRGSPASIPPSEYFLFKAQEKQGQKGKQQEEDQGRERKISSLAASCSGFDRPRCGSCDSQHVTSFTEKTHCKKVNADGHQCSSHSHTSQTSQDLCLIQEAVSLGQSTSQTHRPLSPSQGSSSVSTHHPVSLGQEHCETGAEAEGVYSWATPVVRYSKAQRPTSLPIQPFILLPPSGKPQGQPLGSLLDQYINHRNSKPCSGSQPGSKFKGKGNRLLTHHRPSPLGSHGPILLEAPSSSDTCSTCTPSPDRCHSRPSWACTSTGQGQTYSSPNRPYTSPGLTQTSPKLSNTKLTQAHVCLDQIYPDLGPTYPGNTVLNQTHSSPNQTRCSPAQTQPSPVNIQTCQDFIHLQPERTHTNTVPSQPQPVQTHSPRCHALAHTPLILPSTRHTHNTDLLMSSLSLPPPLLPQKRFLLPSAAVVDCASSHCTLTATLSSVAPLSSLSSLLSLATSGLQPQQAQDSAGPAGSQHQHHQQHCDSSTLSDRPPVEFSLSPDTSYESLSISHLQRTGLLKSVSLAVDLILAHFGTSRDPEEKMRLGNSSRSPSIGGLVLEHLCPTIQNILEDGLRDHKLDLIIGQHRNHTWSVVEASAQTGPSTGVISSLVSKVRQCPLLTSHSMRLRAFIMGLLNLRALEFWLNHLYNQKDVVATHYHPWGFLPTSQGQCQPLFQELLLLLQPLSLVPFDLNLLLEPRLLHNRQLCSDGQGIPPASACSTFLITSWPLLRGDRQGASASVEGARDSHRLRGDLQQPVQQGSSLGSKVMKQKLGGPIGEPTNANRSLRSATSPGWWQRQPAHVEGVVKGVDCSQSHTNIHPKTQHGMEGRRQGERLQETRREERGPTAHLQEDSPSQQGLRWAKLFGAGMDPPTRTQRATQSLNRTQAKRRPSEWLQLNRSELGLLAQTVWSGKWSGPQSDRDHHQS